MHHSKNKINIKDSFDLKNTIWPQLLNDCLNRKLTLKERFEALHKIDEITVCLIELLTEARDGGNL